jgi:hypothetical protein
VAFPDAGGGTANVTLFDQSGTSVGTWEFSSDEAGFSQVSVGSVSGPLPLGRAEIEVREGRAAAYASVVDNVTGDSSLFPFEPLPALAQDVLVNGVARAAGRNNTFFRTDARIFNPGPGTASLAVSFLRSGSENANPASATIPVPAGQILDVVDVLEVWFSAPVPATGALRVRTDSPVAVLCRTSNVDPSGTKPGTFGAQQKPRPLLSFLSSADAGTLLTGVRQNAGYRTNVGFAAGPEGAAWKLTLRDADGADLATGSDALGAFGWKQPNVQDLFAGTAIPDDAQLLVQVTSGSLDVYDSSVDNASGDSVVSAFEPIPVEIPSSATIGPEGGSVRSEDGRMTLRIPAGALAAPTSVSLEPSGAAVTNGLGSGYALTVDGAAFAKSPIATFRYGREDLEGSSAEWLGLGYQSGGTLYGLAGPSCDTAVRTISAPLAGTPASSYRREPLSIFQIDLSPIVYLKLTPGAASTLSRGTVTFQLTGIERPIFQGQGPNPILRPVDFSRETLSGWSINRISGSGSPGTVARVGPSTFTYTAPDQVQCDDVVEIQVHVARPAGDVTASARVRHFPRDWRVWAQAHAVVNYCTTGTGGARFKVTTDTFELRLSLLDDMTFVPAGPGSPGDQGHVAGMGALNPGTTFCVPDCTCQWAAEPTPELQFKVNIGGAARGRFYFDFWGFLLNKDGFQKWAWTCECPPNRTITVDGLLPNMTGSPVTTPRLWFDGPATTRNGCRARKVYSWQDFLRMMGLPVVRGDPFAGTTYSVYFLPIG